MFNYYLSVLNKTLLVFFLITHVIHVDAFWKHLPWGTDDEIGATNRITPTSVLEAVTYVKTGKTYSLGIIIDANTPSVPGRILQLTVVHPNQVGRTSFTGVGENRLSSHDDVLYAWLGTGSQIDGLGHVGIGNLFYNGNDRNNFTSISSGLSRLGLEKLPPVVTRGILLDMASYFGVDIVPGETAFTRDDIRGAAKKQGIEIKEGDVVLFHSGWLDVIDKQNDAEKFISTEPGIDASGAWELVQKKVVAVGADTWGVEVFPAKNPAQFFKAHQILLTRNGIFILENMDTRQLARDKVYEFMFVLGVTKIRGTVQMMINPTAIA